MGFCTRCGFELGIGRFCTNCGHPVAGGPAPEGPAPDDPVAPPAEPHPARTPDSSSDSRSASRPAWWIPSILVGVALGLVLAVALWFLLGGDEPDDRSPDDPTPASAPDEDEEVDELAASATARVPATAPPTRSLGGEPVDFEAPNLTDGDRTTAWRMPGDGAGQQITLELADEAVVTSVGLVNGYAKTDTDQAGNPVRWYRHNRRIEQVTWIFDDGTEVVQELRATQRMQTVDVPGIRTSTVLLRLDAVSAPGATERARDFTPVSEISVAGGPPGRG